jgi:hypothetical protein
MGKSTNFSGQPIFTQLLNLLDKSKISKSSKALGADKYVKRFTSYKHVVVMLFADFEGYNSIRETVLRLTTLPIGKRKPKPKQLAHRCAKQIAGSFHPK